MQQIKESIMVNGECAEGATGYVLITPARNEVDTIGMTIASVVHQTMQPLKWVIVSDGSTDGTDELVNSFAARYTWIELVRNPVHRERHFAGKVEAFNVGYARVKDMKFAVVANLDADVSLDDPRYFEFLISKFAENPKLGVCGTSYTEYGVIYPGPFTSPEDVTGACQVFRRECFEEIDGYSPIKIGGVDVLAFLDARAKGWQTRTFAEKCCVHHRKVGSAQHQHLYERLFQAGRKTYLLGSHPLWELVRCLYQMKNRPYLVGAVLTLTGYMWALASGAEKALPRKLVKLRQDEQMRRLKKIVLGKGTTGVPMAKEKLVGETLGQRGRLPR